MPVVVHFCSFFWQGAIPSTLCEWLTASFSETCWGFFQSWGSLYIIPHKNTDADTVTSKWTFFWYTAGLSMSHLGEGVSFKGGFSQGNFPMFEDYLGTFRSCRRNRCRWKEFRIWFTFIPTVINIKSSFFSTTARRNCILRLLSVLFWSKWLLKTAFD